MERNALYRRARSPVMGAIGLTCLAAAVVAVKSNINSGPAFATYWLVIAALCLVEAFVLVRRQALADNEMFWSPPTRRVAQAILPALFCGLAAGIACIRFHPNGAWLLPQVWMALYGCAVHAAGYFMPRGFKLFGWGFIAMACAWTITAPASLEDANWAMGVFFGGAHAAYGIYLFFTEKQGVES